ncbi:MAG: FUSC family protein [Pseudomonadota bacterium]
MSFDRVQPFVTAGGVVLATGIALAMHFESPWWAAISAWIVAHPETQKVIEKGAYRIIGTLAGCLGGYLVASMTEGITLLQVTVIGFGFTAATYARFTAEHAYAWVMFWLVGALTVFVSMQAPSSTTEFVYFRSLEICTGVTAIAVLSILAQPWRSGAHAAHPEQNASAPGYRDDVAVAAVFGGLVATLTVIMWQFFALPSQIQVVVSVFTAVAPSLRKMEDQITQRLAGCLVGGAAGLLVTSLGVEILWIWMALLFAGIFATSFLHHSEGKYTYVGTQAGMAYIICMVADSGPQTSILPVIDRAVGIGFAYLILALLLAALGPWLRLIVRRLNKRHRAQPYL